jgi:very-short-patch-repair endonuclease
MIDIAEVRSFLVAKGIEIGGAINKELLRTFPELPSYNSLWRRGLSLYEVNCEIRKILNLKVCKHCSVEFYSEDKNATFCSHSCSASYNNKINNRKPWTDAQKLKARGKRQRRKLKEQFTVSQKYIFVGPPKPNYLKFKNPPAPRDCKVCSKPLDYVQLAKRHKCCSHECRVSILEKNRGRHKRSYLEESFEKWLISKGIAFKSEVKIKNNSSGKLYFVDFIFENNVIIELDGTQHLKTVEEDRIRDEYLTSVGYTVLRIPHKKYVSGEMIEVVEELLKDITPAPKISPP